MGDTFSLRHAPSDCRFSFAGIVRHPGKESEVSGVALDGAASVEQPERDGPEADAPAAIGQCFESYELVCQAVAQVPLRLVDSDDTVGVGPLRREVPGVHGVLEVAWIASLRRPVELGGHDLAESFVRALVIVIVFESVERTLLCREARSRRPSRLRLQRPVHSLVSPVLLGMAWQNPLGANSELDPPDGKPREAADCHRSKGWSVVGPNHIR